MCVIHSRLSPQDLKKAECFLANIRPLLATKEFTIKQTEKNRVFDRQYNLRDAEKLEILKSLSASDCIKIEPNDNPRYSDTEVYCFLKNKIITVFGESETLCIYIKMYIQELSNHDIVIVISFHKEGMHGS